MSSIDLSSSVPALSASSTTVARQIFIGEIPQPEGWILDPLDEVDEDGEIEPFVFSLLPTDFDQLIEFDSIKSQMEEEEARLEEQGLSPNGQAESGIPLATITEPAMTIKVGRHFYEVTKLEVISREGEKVQVQLGQRLVEETAQRELAGKKKEQNRKEMEQGVYSLGLHYVQRSPYKTVFRSVVKVFVDRWEAGLKKKDEKMKEMKQEWEDAGKRKDEMDVKRMEKLVRKVENETEELMEEKWQWQEREKQMKDEIEHVKTMAEKEMDELREEKKRMEEELEKITSEMETEKEEHNKAIEQLRGESKKTKETAKKTGKQN